MQAGAGTASDIAVAVFEQRGQAEQALRALRASGLDDQQMSLVSASASPEDLLRLGVGAAESGDLQTVLVGLGLPTGQARFYDRQVREGGSLVVVRAGERAPEARQVLRAQGGTDVESAGAALVRAPEAGDEAAGAPPPDLTTRWEDVASRYEMLWGQHYGAEGGEWTDYEPVYRYAWEVANRAADRGSAWETVEPSLRRDWEARGSGVPWSDVAGAVQDVWQDVADEARTGAEGGAARRTAGPLE